MRTKEKLDEQMFVQNDESLSIQEAESLNRILHNDRDTFDFRDKRIAFISGSSGNKILPKKKYFDTCITPWISEGMIPQTYMIVLTNQEKVNSGGYDALVFSWVKYVSKSQKKRIIIQLAKIECSHSQ